MKQLLISTALLVSGTFCFSSQAGELDPQLQSKLDQAYFLYDHGHYQESLEHIQWLFNNGIATDYDFTPHQIGIITRWGAMRDLYEPARVSYDSALKDAITKLKRAPHNCAAFDDVEVMMENKNALEDFVSVLENDTAEHPEIWQRCWDYSTSLIAVEQTSKPLIDAYLVDLSDHFKTVFIPVIDGLYSQCYDDYDYRELCQDSVKEYLTGVSASFRHAAMTHYGLNEAGQIGGLTLQLLLKWQTQDN
ncbi:hypothetical protein [Pseudoalteromonas sp. OOF1S-7]|uniref:hypothetical protein n=1 Tax=Pseudoalteromonas sp. OOF1S-7 TaxID=2917757 RepID=UPI001EF4E072|nr:hypothetical protein [Pseudoalteromonas sp. OOF1S-7]MCG7535980.1 hypothetical protein [Pseudoalteromonas sp. OOF1S-7]